MTDPKPPEVSGDGMIWHQGTVRVVLVLSPELDIPSVLLFLPTTTPEDRLYDHLPLKVAEAVQLITKFVTSVRVVPSADRRARLIITVESIPQSQGPSWGRMLRVANTWLHACGQPPHDITPTEVAVNTARQAQTRDNAQAAARSVLVPIISGAMNVYLRS